MWYKIKEGRHRAYPLSLGIHTGKTSESYEVIFDDSCRYTLEGTDKEDCNKLFGWSYGWHHQNSVRCGWKYNSESDKIQLALYTYDSGIRKIYDIPENKVKVEIPLNERVVILLMRTDDGIVHLDTSENAYDQGVLRTDYSVIPKWGYSLGLYFGGRNDKTGKDNVAPHDMKIWIKKLKKH